MIGNQLMNFKTDAPPWVPTPALEELMLCGHADIVAEIVALFCMDTKVRLAAARKAAMANDVTRVRAQAHAIRGSAMQVGAGELVAACADLEEIVFPPPPALTEMVLSVEKIFERAAHAMAR